jgi:hypothetical protein
LVRINAPLAETSFVSGIAMMSIRPVWIIGDLAIIYDWLNAASRKSNWDFNHNRVSVMQHFKRILISDEMQSFMLEQNSLPAMQIDLLPITLLDFPKSSEYSKFDYGINYLYRENFRDPDVFKNGLELFTAFVFSHPEPRNIFLRLPGYEPVARNTLESIGFQQVHLNSFFGKSSDIYKISRQSRL